jgi:outer membrane protein OmpA-like peptidoglycan-associated protein
MKALRGAVIGGAILLASASSGFAQSAPSWLPFQSVYVRGDFGGAFGTDTTFKNLPSLPGGSGSTEPSTVGNSIMYGGGVGVRFNPMFRSDITIDGIKRLDIEGHNAVAGGVSSSAHVSSIVGLVNGYLDLNGIWPNVFGRFQPYIDAGVGVARNDLSRTSFAAGGANIGSVSSHAVTGFAWGAGAGVAYAIIPNLLLDLSYKYLDLGEMHSGTTLSLGAARVNTARMDADLKVHTVMLGVRYEFGPAPAPAPTPVAAPPAPPPAAVAPQKQVFIVFFEFDKSALTPDGRKVVDSAAAAFKAGKQNVAIAGYTDLSGTQQYNLALSKRRADAVKGALVRDGVPASAIDESWFGKQNPRVPTADGVREPQNRRVEITM